MRNRFSGGRTRGAEETQCVNFSWCERSSISSWCLIWIFKLDGEISENMATPPPILDSQEARTIWRRIGGGVTIRANDVMRGISAGGCLQSRRVSEVARKQTGKLQRKIQCQSKGNCHPSGWVIILRHGKSTEVNQGPRWLLFHKHVVNSHTAVKCTDEQIKE